MVRRGCETSAVESSCGVAVMYRNLSEEHSWVLCRDETVGGRWMKPYRPNAASFGADSQFWERRCNFGPHVQVVEIIPLKVITWPDIIPQPT